MSRQIAVFGMAICLLISGCGMYQIKDSEQTSSIVAYWRFDEKSKTTAKDSVGQNDGTIFGARYAKGIVEDALNFDGEDNYVEVPHSDSLNVTTAITIEAFIKRENTGTHMIIGKRDATNIDRANFQLAFINNKLSFFWMNRKGMKGRFDSVEEFIDSEWHHYAVTFSNNRVDAPTLYKDGKIAEGEWIEGDETIKLTANDIDITIGTIYPLQSFFEGKIDELAIYSRALTSKEIKQHYNNGIKGIGYEK